MKNYPLYDHPLLRASARIAEDGRVSVDARGLLRAVPGVKDSLEMIDGQYPAFAGEKLYISTWIPPIPSRAFDRLVDSRIKGVLGKRTPDQVTISITEECPNRCIHCALPNSGNKLRLEPDVVKDVISQILDMGTTLVIFDGGEPTTYRELPDLVASVDDRAISTMFTSGAGFTEALAAKLKDAGLYAVNISLDSARPEEHDAMRGRFGVFQDAMNCVKNALSAGLMVDVYVVLRSGNFSQIGEFHDLARRCRAHELTFFEVVPVGRWSGKKDVILRPEDHAALHSFAAGSPGPRIFSVPDALLRFGCFAGRNWMHIAPSGDVYPCACLPEVCGNIFNEQLAVIWRNMARLHY
ncbi:MAG TPA: radical SAM protein, partial [Methanotrichaceae archaeon]|nr:radical SAM protein [Methanotrichaceae archaeon]